MGGIPDSDIRLVQVARMLSLGSHTVTAERARAEIASRPGDFARAFLEEAAASDDVTSTETALDYLESRLAEFGELVERHVAITVRGQFEQLLASWEG
ncbi:MAG: hypothetical protein ACKVT1_03535 [Dehalococcoidia bacterium]